MQIRAAVLSQMEQPLPYAQTRPIAIETVNLAAPGPNEVLVRITGAGRCHSPAARQTDLRCRLADRQ